MIRLRRNGAFKSSLTIEHDDRPLTILERFVWKGEAQVFLNGQSYLFTRKGLPRIVFTMHRGDEEAASLVQDGTFRVTRTMEHGGHTWHLTNRSWMDVSQVIHKDGEEVGVIRKESGHVIIEGAEELPFDVRVFLGWITLTLWEQLATGSTAAVAG